MGKYGGEIEAEVELWRVIMMKPLYDFLSLFKVLGLSGKLSLSFHRRNKMICRRKVLSLAMRPRVDRSFLGSISLLRLCRSL